MFMYIRNNQQTTTPNLQQGDNAQSQWDPNTISNIIFGIIMIFIGIIAIWQGCRRQILAIDEEELVIIRSSRASTSLTVLPRQANASIESHVPTHMLTGDSSLTMAQLPIDDCSHCTSYPSPANEELYAPPLPDRVTTLSTIESMEDAATSMPSMVEYRGKQSGEE